MKIVTLNVWRYFEWKNRKDKVIDFLKKQKADIIFLQEVAYDDRLKDKWRNQVEEINKALKYKNIFYGKLRDMIKWHQEPISWKMHYGLGILTNYPITKRKLVILPHVELDKNFGFLYMELQTPKGKLDIINVHLENTDGGSKEQLKYILSWCEKREIKPIIAGDFNMRITSNLKLATDNYNISYFIKPYKSFMPSTHTTTKIPITLDYIMAHKNKFGILSIKCIKNKISDHYPLLAKIIIQNKKSEV